MTDNFTQMRLRYDADGNVEIAGQVMVPTKLIRDTGKVIVVKRAGHRYNSLTTQNYAPAEFEVYAVIYPATEPGGYAVVEKLVQFPVRS